VSVLGIAAYLHLANTSYSSAAPIVLSFGWNASGRTGQGTSAGNALIADPISATNLAGKTITSVEAGGAHSLLTASDGTAFSFGFGLHTGIGTNGQSATSATLMNLSNLGDRKVVQASAGTTFSLLLTDDGAVFSFGSMGGPQLGRDWPDNSAFVATEIDASNLAGRKIKQVSAGLSHNLILADDGTVFSFGSNASGATGMGVSTGSTPIATPIDATYLQGKKIKQVSAGGELSLLLAEDGTVFSFGDNQAGQTGLGTAAGDTLIATPIDTTNLAGRTNKSRPVSTLACSSIVKVRSHALA
jgi:alpha-tubulin suppressor-like RCC1 family protein